MFELLAAASLLSSLAASHSGLAGLAAAAAATPDARRAAVAAAGLLLQHLPIVTADTTEHDYPHLAPEILVQITEEIGPDRFYDIRGLELKPELCTKLLRSTLETVYGVSGAPEGSPWEGIENGVLRLASERGLSWCIPPEVSDVGAVAMEESMLSTFVDVLGQFFTAHPVAAEDSAAVKMAIQIAQLFTPTSDTEEGTPGDLITELLRDLCFKIEARDYVGARETLWDFIRAHPIAAFSLLLALAVYFAPGTAASLVLTPLGFGVLGPIAGSLAAFLQGTDTAAGSVFAILQSLAMGGGAVGWLKSMAGAWAAGQMGWLGKEWVRERGKEWLDQKGKERFGEAWPVLKRFWGQGGGNGEEFCVWEEAGKWSN